MTLRLAPVVAAGGLLIAMVSAIGAIGLRLVDPVPMLESTFGFSDAALVGFETFGVTFAAVGGLLIVRRPGNSVGWLMVVGGVSHACGGLGAAITSSLIADGPAAAGTASVGAWATLACVSAGASVFALAIIFPTGRGHTPRWDAFAWLYLIGLTLVVALVLTQPGPLNTFPTIENPFAIGPQWAIDGVPMSRIAVSASVLLAPVCLWAIVARYRVSSTEVRQQMKWFILAMLVGIVALAAALLAPLLTDRPPQLGLVLFGFGGTLIAVAVGIAILRYRLYEIDRIISRTIGWTLVTGGLVVVFVASVVALQVVLADFTQGQTIAVAASTLLAFALFQPLRRRVQTAIDRRFDRARYDAERTSAAFAGRLRDEVDIDAVASDLRATVETSIRPSALGLWLREPTRGGR